MVSRFRRGADEEVFEIHENHCNGCEVFLLKVQLLGARKMGMEERYMEDIYKAACLHTQSIQLMVN